MALKWAPDSIIPRAIGSVALAGVDSVLNNRAGQLVGFLRNGDMVNWLTIGANLFIQPREATVLNALNAAADAAMFDLANSLFTTHMLPFPTLEGFIPGGTALPSTAAGAAAVGSTVPATTTTTTLQTSPIPAASMSAAGDVATAGY